MQIVGILSLKLINDENKKKIATKTLLLVLTLNKTNKFKSSLPYDVLEYGYKEHDNKALDIFLTDIDSFYSPIS